MSQLTEFLFNDAHRRVCLAKERSNTDRSKIWVGLQYPSQMKELIAKGLVAPVSGETPRCLSWYMFTEKGWAEYDRKFKDAPDWFSPEYANFQPQR